MTGVGLFLQTFPSLFREHSIIRVTQIRPHVFDTDRYSHIKAMNFVQCQFNNINWDTFLNVDSTTQVSRNLIMWL